MRCSLHVHCEIPIAIKEHTDACVRVRKKIFVGNEQIVMHFIVPFALAMAYTL